MTGGVALGPVSLSVGALFAFSLVKVLFVFRPAVKETNQYENNIR